MDSKHFSHHHPLVFHQVHQGSQLHCSGCKTPASGNVYACWQCSYFLHDLCFHAARSLNHPSHPPHPLTLVPFPTYPSSSFFCNSCNLAGDGFSYTCSACEFDIHVHCALMPNYNNPVYPPPNPLYPPSNPIQAYPPQPQPIGYPPMQSAFPAFPPTQHYPPPAHQTPQNYASPPPPPNPTTADPPNPTAPTYSTVVNATTSTAANQLPPTPSESKPPTIIKHFSHPHVLKNMEIEQTKAKVCSACECELTGSAYCCTESFCNFNLHKSCFDSPHEVRHKSHLDHPLTLLTAPPYSDGFTCNACLKDGKAFAYNCATCSYDLHIDCVQWPDTVNRPDHQHMLTLFYSSPIAAASEAAAFMCDVCKNPVHEMAWLYYCRECDFGTHLECVASGIQQQSGDSAAKSEEELLREMEMKFAVLQLLLGAQGQRSSVKFK